MEQALDPAARLLLSGLLALFMFSVALGFQVSDFRELLQRPRLVLAGLVAQVLLLPAITLPLSRVFALTPSIADEERRAWPVP